MKKCIKLITASAGAGKTHFLTNQYIDLLLEGDDDSGYRHILAVTFTNKATDEMKDRVIKELFRISRDKSDSRQAKAERRLVKILHDYSGFSVSTIDSFFQIVMRSFAREIGQYASYRVELDQNAVITQVVDRMLDSIEDAQNEELLNWLRRLGFSQIENGGNWDIRKLLTQMSGHFFSEDFKRRLSSSSSIIEDKRALASFEENLGKTSDAFENAIRDYGQRVLAIIRDNGWDWDDFKGKSRTPFKVFEKWKLGKTEAPKPLEKFEDSLKKGDSAGLMDVVREATDYYVLNYPIYKSALLIRSNVFLLGIFSDLYCNLTNYLKENNVVLLSQSADLLNKIIDGSDTPFVYEKIGTRYNHILLDESQDTSLLQWENFKPLFIESRSSGFTNLIVGDIKQSIYRWRGSDWKLISDYAVRDLGEEYVDKSISLDFNWRSTKAVIDFNNNVFSRIGEYLSVLPSADASAIKELYSSSIQNQPSERKDKPVGRVKVGFIGLEDQWRECALEKMVSDIEELKSAGYRCSDISILVRLNSEGADVANFLISEGYSVITEDSLKIGSSHCVARVMALLNYAIEPDDPVNQIIAEGLSAEVTSTLTGSLYDICENLLRENINEVTPDQVPFVNAFMDAVVAYQDKYGSSVRGFVSWWNESGCKKSICAPEGQDAIRIMTIHKSKGLSLEAVIIPFLDGHFSRTGDTVWFDAPEPFSSLGLVPLVTSSRLSETLFAQQYNEEIKYQYIDNINTTYVALTRAKSQLIIYCPVPKDIKDFKVDSFSNYLYRFLENELDDDLVYTTGDIGNVTFALEKQSDVVLDHFSCTPVGDRLKMSFSKADIFSESEIARRHGIDYHAIMSRVTVFSDVDLVCKRDPVAMSHIRQWMTECPVSWFDGSSKVLNETAIVTAEGDVFRPDRVLVAPDGSVTVIDYKFGSQVRESYNSQVANYCALIREMGISENIEGYVWYVELSSIVKAFGLPDGVGEDIPAHYAGADKFHSSSENKA